MYSNNLDAGEIFFLIVAGFCGKLAMLVLFVGAADVIASNYINAYNNLREYSGVTCDIPAADFTAAFVSAEDQRIRYEVSRINASEIISQCRKGHRACECME